jgi:hypothetical protein
VALPQDAGAGEQDGRQVVAHADRVDVADVDIKLARPVAKSLVQVGDSQRSAPIELLAVTAPGYHAQSVDVPASATLDHSGVELLRLPPRQSLYRTDLLHTDVRLRPVVPAEHVDQFRPQMLEVA